MQIIAHRGASRYAPENTVAAFDLALAMGCRALETDVRLTADGVPVLMHDATVDRVTDGRGPVDRLTWAEISALRVKDLWEDAEDLLSEAPVEPVRVMRLEEFLERYLGGSGPGPGGRPVQLVLELKAPGTPEAVCRALAPYADRVSPDRVFVTSFDPELLARARRLMPAVSVGLLTRTVDLAALDACARLQAEQVCPHARTVTSHAVEAAHRERLQVRVWGVGSDPDLLRRAWEAGADGATTDAPDLGLALVRVWERQRLRANGLRSGAATASAPSPSKNGHLSRKGLTVTGEGFPGRRFANESSLD